MLEQVLNDIHLLATGQNEINIGFPWYVYLFLFLSFFLAGAALIGLALLFGL